jgi:isocitrate/isopropylmalate dehydrogenase
MNNLSNMIKVAVVGGEGIGPEVTAQSHRVLNWFAARRNLPMILREAQYGLIPYLATGKVLPQDTIEAMDEADAILWGATGGPETKEVPAAARKAGSLLSLRSKYDLYANLRPIVANPALADSAPLKADVLKGVNFVIIRELTSGIYFALKRLPTGSAAVSTPSNIRQIKSAVWRGPRSNWHGRAKARSARSTRPTCWRPACYGARKSPRCTPPIFPMSSSAISMSTMPPCRSSGSRRSST